MLTKIEYKYKLIASSLIEKKKNYSFIEKKKKRRLIL